MPQWRQGASAIRRHISRENRAFGETELDLARSALAIEGQVHGIPHLQGADELGKFFRIVEFLPIGHGDDIPTK